jgi:hypothetical protein
MCQHWFAKNPQRADGLPAVMFVCVNDRDGSPSLRFCTSLPRAEPKGRVAKLTVDSVPTDRTSVADTSVVPTFRKNPRRNGALPTLVVPQNSQAWATRFRTDLARSAQTRFNLGWSARRCQRLRQPSACQSLTPSDILKGRRRPHPRHWGSPCCCGRHPVTNLANFLEAFMDSFRFCRLSAQTSAVRFDHSP